MTKLTLSAAKYQHLLKLSSPENIIGALAIDQRGALRKMLLAQGYQATDDTIVAFKELVSQELTPYASSILLDPEYGIPASQLRHDDCGLIVAYEKTGYDASTVGRLPDLLPNWSAKRIKELGADAVKVLIYYDCDDSDAINDIKKAWVERVGSECRAEDIPYFLEILTYASDLEDVKSEAYAKLKPHKVIEAMKTFSDDRYGADVLKVEVPVNMAYVEGFTKDGVTPLYSRQEALDLFKAQSDATHLPYIFLSAGVSAQLFQETLYFAKEAGASFNGVLCGRATWANAVSAYAQDGQEAGRQWLADQGRKNIEELNAALVQTATPWTERVDLES